MAKQSDTGITWTEQTWNPIRGCSRVNEDCRNCYAERVAMRFCTAGQPYWGLVRAGGLGGQFTPLGWNGQVRVIEHHLEDPLRWKRPRLVFVNSMSDLFHENLPDEQIDRIVAVMALAKRHTFQVLTKRPARMADYLHSRGRGVLADLNRWPLPNVWWGASMGHQKAVDQLGPALLRCRDHAKVLWVSAEPLTERIDLRGRLLPGEQELQAGPINGGFLGGPFVDWVVAGGESGPGARPCHPDWIRSIRDDCQRAGVPFHFKQWGEWEERLYTSQVSGRRVLKISLAPDDQRERVLGEGQAATNVVRVGKKAAGRLLDGRTWDEWPRGWTPRQTGA
jgi:protein gp37